MKVMFLKTKAIKILLICLGFVAFDLTLNATLYNPTFITPIYDFFLKSHIIDDEGAGYPLISIHTLNWGLYSGPRATVIGSVVDVIKSGDGDDHINIMSQDGSLVAEIIPEYPLPVPLVGDKIRIWGITRYDIAHRWWELHPVMGWKKISQ